MKEIKNDLIVAIPLRNAVYEIEELVKNILNTNKSSIIFYISDNFSNDGFLVPKKSSNADDSPGHFRLPYSSSTMMPPGVTMS